MEESEAEHPAAEQPVADQPVAQPQAAAAPASQPPVDEPEGADVNYDPEVAAIFSEEATELLEACQSSFQGIGLTAPRKEEFAALKRPPHTLKGGARMAGVKPMGDLGHELESLIIGIELGNVPPSQEARETPQRSLDELGRMRDLLAGNQPVPNARRLLAQVRALTGNMVANPDTMPNLPVLKAPPQDTVPALDIVVTAPEPAPASEPALLLEAEPEPVAEPAAIQPEPGIPVRSPRARRAPAAEALVRTRSRHPGG